MAEALEDSNYTLNSLLLGQNNVTDEGAEYLAEALKHSNCKLNSLDLTNTKSRGVDSAQIDR